MSGDKKAVANSFVQTGTKPPENQPLGCPRCQSSNTKFCYYNNYNLSQPRHFCKSCRRYWTHGGTLRNIPVGGGTRKSSAVKRSRPTVLSSTLTIHDPIPGSNSEMGHQVNDLNLNQAAVCQQVEEAVVGFSGEFGSGSGICGLGFELCPWDWTVGEGGGGASCFNTWQVESGLGDGDCYGSWSDLSISTPGNGVK